MFFRWMIKGGMLLGLGLIIYIGITYPFKERQENIPAINIDVDPTNANLIKALLEDNSVLREEQKQREQEALRFAKINEYIKEGNETLKTVCTLIFGEYETYLTLTHTEDTKNVIEVGAKFQVAYGIDLLQGQMVYNESKQQIELQLPKASVEVAYCKPVSEIVTIGEKKSLLNTLMIPWEVAKREPLKSTATNLLIRDSVDYVQKPFEELEAQATYVVERLLQSIPIDSTIYQAIQVVWI